MVPALSGGAEVDEASLPVAWEAMVEVLVDSVVLPSLSVTVSTTWVTLAEEEPLVPLGPFESAVVVGLGVPPAETATQTTLVFAPKTRASLLGGVLTVVLVDALLGAAGELVGLGLGAVTLGALGNTVGSLVDLGVVGVGDSDALGRASDVTTGAACESKGQSTFGPAGLRGAWPLTSLKAGSRGRLLGRQAHSSRRGLLGSGAGGRLGSGSNGEDAGSDDGGETHREVCWERN